MRVQIPHRLSRHRQEQVSRMIINFMLSDQIDSPPTDVVRDEINPSIERRISYRRPLFVRHEFNFVEEHDLSTRGPSRRQGLKLALWSWLSIITDGLVITAAGCFANLVMMLIINIFFKNDMGFLFFKANRILTMTCVFIFTGWIYFIATRALVGASIGEWTCSIRLGQPSERLSESYMYKLLIRTTLSLMTGIICLPLLSLVVGKDLLGLFSGLKLYSLK